jgi:hypothetical protein
MVNIDRGYQQRFTESNKQLLFLGETARERLT